MHTFHLDRCLVVRGLVKVVQVPQKYLLLGEDDLGTRVCWSIRYSVKLIMCILYHPSMSPPCEHLTHPGLARRARTAPVVPLNPLYANL